MVSWFRSCKTAFANIALLPACVALMILLAPANLHASPVTYNLVLTPGPGSLYGGTGSLTIDDAPAVSGISDYTMKSGKLEDLTFTLDGQTFTLAGATGNPHVRFLNGTLNDITFSQTIGTSPNRFTLHSTATYVFYYNNGQAASYGTFTATVAPPLAPPASSPVPEPGSIFLLGTGLLAGAGTLYRRFATPSFS